MFEALVQRLLNNILGEYIQNFSAENLKIGIWSGQVILKNVILKKSIIKKLNLPMIIKYSRLGCLKMNIPWKSLTSSKIEVVLEGFQLVVAEVPVEEWNCKNTKIIEKRKKEVEAFCEAVLNDFGKKAEKAKEKSDEGYLSKLIVKIIDNLQITVKDIHIRYQDQLTKLYSFGVTLQEFKLYTVNAKGQPQYIDRSKSEYANQPLRKRLQLYNIGLYWNQKTQFYTEGNCESKMGSTIAKRGQSAYNHHYVILMSSQAELLQREAGKQFQEPEINLQIGLENLKIQITNTQLQQIISIAQRLQRYTRKVKQENRHQLSKDQLRSNRDYFKSIFPDYYPGFGKNLPQPDMLKLQEILQKMQVEHFTSDIKQFLQDKQRERIIKEKKEKNKGWFWGSPKELTPQQLQDIQAYLNDNFGQEVSIVKRPVDYYHLKVGFKMQTLEVVIANTLAIIKQGLQSRFDDLQIAFSLREGGYNLELTLENIAINMFQQKGVDPRQQKAVLYKLNTKSEDNSYVKMVVIGNPLDKKHLNTEIKVTTSELIVLFDPKIIAIATDFADLNVSKENREAAIEKFGEIKETAGAAVSETMEKPTKAQIGVDVVIRTVTVAVPFSPHRQNADCWAINLGSLHFTTDEQTLLRTEISDDLPLDVFNLQLSAFSFRHYNNVSELQDSLTKNLPYERITHAVLNNLDFRLRVQLFSKATQTQSKIKLHTIIPSLQVNLNSFTYKSLLRLGQAFQKEQKIQRSRQTTRIQQKKQIQSKASKIGFVYIKDGLTKIWKRYVAIMSENYIYLFLNKSDKDYYAYYYIKGAKLEKYKDPLDKDKPHHFRIKNSVNEVVFGFNKEEEIEDWKNKIEGLTKEQEIVEQVLSATLSNLGEGILNVAKDKNHNQLNLWVNAEIQTIGIKVFTTDSEQDKVIGLKFQRLAAQVELFQSKRKIKLELFSLQLQDTLEYYKSMDLVYFLETKHQSKDENLINISIQQLNKDHPQYDQTDSNINVSFGTLTCNYKCQTVKALMGFFIPPPSDQPNQATVQTQSQDSETTTVSTISESVMEFQVYSLKLNLKIEEISLTLVNQKIKTVIGTLGITSLNLYMGISTKRTALIGSLKDLYYIDTTSYPNTIFQQQQEYPNKRYILTANIGENKNMLDFNIQILKNLNEYRKNMLIDVKLANLTTYYVQQPVLRLITYLNAQMLPSFDTGPKEAKVVAPKDTKPEPTTMDLKVELTNISVFVETQYQPTNRDRQEYMQLNIARITVQNQSSYRAYVLGQQKKPIILVENYLVKLYAMSIGVRYFDPKNQQHRYKLTNNLDFTVSTDLIANPQFYKREIPQMFDNGMRLSCEMTSFFMRLNHDDYSFIMKCLNWGVTHNDGLDNVLFDIPAPVVKVEELKPQEKDPFYLTVKMDCISLFVTQDNLPIAFLELDKMDFSFSATTQATHMQLKMNRLYGTSIQHNKEEKTLIERGVFNSLGYSAKHPLQAQPDLDGFIKMFNIREKIQRSELSDFLTFTMVTTEQSTDITIKMNELCIDIDLRLLLLLSNLANTDQNYIKGPNPIKSIQPANKQELKEKPAQPSGKKFALVFSMNKLIGSVCDSSKEKFVFIEGEIYFSMINYGDKTIDDLQHILRESQVKRSISHSSMNAYLKNFTVYFSRVKEGRLLSKREFLQPMVIDFDQKRLYEHEKELHVLSTSIRLKTTALLLSASLKDMLNINKILQDNLKVLGESQPKPQEEQKKQEVKRQDIGQQLQKLQQRLAREIQTTTKIIGQIAPIQLQVVNDCGNNFMPVLRLIIQQTKPAMRQTIINSELIIVPIINIFFFNPRSSRWQPIIEPFKTTLNYSTITINNQRSVSITVKTDPNGQTSSLKINISTQMMSTIMAATDIVKAEKDKIDRDVEEREIEVSPFVFENITNERVFVVRRDGEYELPSLFKGPVRISDDKEIVFRLKDQVHKFSTDHYGVFKIPKSDYLIKFDTQKLNRVVRFLPLLSLKNRLEQTIYVRRSGKVSEVPLQVEKNEWIPLDNVQTFSLSLNGQSYSEVSLTKGLKLGAGFVLAQKKNFLILMRYKDKQGKYAVVDLLPPFVVYNCLPKALNLQFILKAKTKSTVSIPPQQSHSIFTSEDIPALEIKATAVGYTWSKKFKYRQERDESESQLQLGDDSDHHTILNYLFKRNKGSNQYKLTVYCKKIIINELHDKLLVYGNFQEDQKEKRQDSFKLLGGQKRNDDSFDDKIIMIGEEVGNKLRVCGSHSIFDFATPISIGGLGESQARIVVDRQYQGKRDSLFTLIGVEISAIKMAKSCDIFCKKITLKSKSIIINTTKHDMVIKQENATKYKFTSQAGSKKNFVFGMPDIQGRQYRYSFRSEGFHQSRLFTLPTQGTAYFKLVSQVDGKEVYFKIYVKEHQSYSFFEISQITSDDFPYQVVVKSASLKVQVPALGKTVLKGQALRFFKQGEEQQHIVEIVVTHEQSREELTFKVCPDDLKYKVKDLLRVQRGGLIGSIAIMVQVTISDKQRSIVIDEVSRMQQPKQVQQSALSIDISQIILSINQNSQSIEIPFESMVLTLKRLLFIQYQTDRKKQYQLKLGFLQIDQAYPYIISSPVILTPYKYEQFTREKDPKSVFNFTITFSKEFVKNTFIDQISVDVNDIVANFSADFINLATLISNEFGEVINFKETTYFIDKSTEKWQQIVLPPQQNSVYIRAIKISPFIIDLSAQLNIKKLNLQNNLLLTTILSTVGVVMSNIDSAPIQMTGIEIDDCIDTVDSITRQLVTHYKQTCIKQFYKIFGSLNIIGNPLSLFRNISTGVKDLKEKPAKGFVNGPAQFGLGIVEGTGSLLAHSVGGAFNSISKVTGTVSTGLATLAFDKEFQEHREKEKMKKPQNVIQGLEKGGKAIFYGFKEGITGVFTQPFQNAKKEGALGFVKGAAKGLAGLVVKPVTGIIDFASKTTEGIKNNALMFEDKAHEERMRYPRVFYSECFILKEYSQQDSALYSILKKVENEEKFQNPVFVDSYETEPEKLFLIILTSGVVHLDIESRKVKWSIEYPQLQLTDNPNKKLLSFKKKGKSSTFFSSNDFDVPIESNEMRELIFELILSLQKEQLSE